MQVVLQNSKDMTHDVCAVSVHYMLLIQQNGVMVSLTRMWFQFYPISVTGLLRWHVHHNLSHSPPSHIPLAAFFPSYGYNTLNLCLCCEGLRVSHRLTMSVDIKECRGTLRKLRNSQSHRWEKILKQKENIDE